MVCFFVFSISKVQVVSQFEILSAEMGEKRGLRRVILSATSASPSSAAYILGSVVSIGKTLK